MSGRSGYRKTSRRVRNRRQPHEMPDWRLSFMLPAKAIGVLPLPGQYVPGVEVMPSGMTVASGKDLDWVLKQAATFIGSVANGQEIITEATLERGPQAPHTSGGETREGIKRVREMVYVPGPSVVYLHRLKRALVVPVNR